ncbi:MAG: hypothetical protein KGR19_08540 [Acidobacteria bacterium]|nr:hypothetical protein [Acidobacteriota bacterium]
MKFNAGQTNPLVIDPAHNRIWWGNLTQDPGVSGSPIGYANLDGSGGAGTLSPSCARMSGAPPTISPNGASSLVVDYASGYLYAQMEFPFDAYGWFVGRAKLDGSDCLQVAEPLGSGGAASRGSAFDPDTGWLYVFRSGLTRSNYMNMNGSLPVVDPWPILPISPSSAATTPRSPFIIKAPKLASGSVSISGSGTAPGSTITLSGAETVDDQITMRVYRGAATKTVKWYRDGVEIPGEAGMSLTATEPGVYKAVFTAGNTAGEIQATSSEVTIASPPNPGPDPTPTPSNSFSAVSAAEPSGSVVTVARVPGAGKLRQVATRASGGKRVSVCSSSRTATSAGRFRLECKPSAATRRAQKKGRVRVTVRVTFTPAGGTARTVTRYVWLRSLKPQFTG